MYHAKTQKRKHLKGEIWEEWPLTYGRNGFSHLSRRVDLVAPVVLLVHFVILDTDHSGEHPDVEPVGQEGRVLRVNLEDGVSVG